MIRRLIIALLIVGCASKLNTNPDDIQVITSDIDRFWSTVDNYEGDLSNALDKEYIKKGTNGLKDFIPKRGGFFLGKGTPGLVLITGGYGRDQYRAREVVVCKNAPTTHATITGHGQGPGRPPEVVISKNALRAPTRRVCRSSSP